LRELLWTIRGGRDPWGRNSAFNSPAFCCLSFISQKLRQVPRCITIRLRPPDPLKPALLSVENWLDRR
jgi:hypothetical protein